MKEETYWKHCVLAFLLLLALLLGRPVGAACKYPDPCTDPLPAVYIYNLPYMVNDK